MFETVTLCDQVSFDSLKCLYFESTSSFRRIVEHLIKEGIHMAQNGWRFMECLFQLENF